MINSIEKYRIFDLALLSLLAVFSEIIGEILHIQLPGAGYYISFSILVAMIAMVRWGYWGTIVYVIAGIPMVFIHDGLLVENILLYPFSYLFLGLTNIFFILIKRNKIKESGFVILIYTVIAHISVSIGKGIGIYILSGEFLRGFISYSLLQLFSVVIVFIVLVIINRNKGLLVDMEEYLLEANSKNEDI